MMLGKHQSMDKTIKRSVRWLEKQSAVTKIVLGFSEACRHKFSPGTLRFKLDVDGGIKINAYSGTGVTDIFVKITPISEREVIKQKIAEKWPV